MLKFLKNHWFFKDFGISRGGRAHVSRMVLFDRDGGPRRRADVVEAVQKLLAKALFTEMFKKWWVS